jgi:hypothetical protein
MALSVLSMRRLDMVLHWAIGLVFLAWLWVTFSNGGA